MTVAQTVIEVAWLLMLKLAWVGPIHAVILSGLRREFRFEHDFSWLKADAQHRRWRLVLVNLNAAAR